MKRLVVFVHGFNGSAVESWNEFPVAGGFRDWWSASDLLFVTYPSTRDSVAGAAYRLRQRLPDFYPTPHPAAMGNRHPARDNTKEPYSELILVGHSLGGVVLRRALADAAQIHKDDGTSSILLESSLRLFSPAQGGFRPTKGVGALRASPLWKFIEIILRASNSYADLEPGSGALTDLRRRTEALAVDYAALRAATIWANPDEIVADQSYDTDRVDSFVDGKNHRSICKPKRYEYEVPWDFAESGSLT